MSADRKHLSAITRVLCWPRTLNHRSSSDIKSICRCVSAGFRTPSTVNLEQQGITWGPGRLQPRQTDENVNNAKSRLKRKDTQSVRIRRAVVPRLHLYNDQRSTPKGKKSPENYPSPHTVPKSKDSLKKVDQADDI